MSAACGLFLSGSASFLLQATKEKLIKKAKNKLSAGFCLE
jgi:hypothetical protein